MTEVEASERIWRPSDHVVTRKIVDETILVPISGNLANMQKIFSINEMGASIWALMDGKRNVTSIKKVLLQEFDVDEDRLEKDLFEFIDNLSQMDLLREIPAR